MEAAALRDLALSGLANRQALLDDRRLEAVERIWPAVGGFACAKGMAATMSIMKFEASAKAAVRTLEFRQVLKFLGNHAI